MSDLLQALQGRIQRRVLLGKAEAHDAGILQQALDDYARRERRYGLTSAQVAAAATETVSP